MVNSRDSVLEARSLSLTRLWILTLEPERLMNPTDNHHEESGMAEPLHQTLKLLVVSDVRRRNRLLSSRQAK